MINLTQYDQVTISIKRCFQKGDEVKDMYEANTTIQSRDFPRRPLTTGKAHFVNGHYFKVTCVHVIHT